MAASNVTVETPDVEHAEEIADLWTALAAGQREYGSHVRAAPNRAQIHQSIMRHITGERLLIARAEDIHGFVMFSVEGGAFEQDTDRGFVENLYVCPEDRDEGIGTALLKAAERALRDRGVETVALNVMAANEAARRFYRRHGYDPHRLELEKPLDDAETATDP